jgi:hypothetical protein
MNESEKLFSKIDAGVKAAIAEALEQTIDVTRSRDLHTQVLGIKL